MNHIISKLVQTSLTYDILTLTVIQLSPPHSITLRVLFFVITYYSKYMKTRCGKEILNFNKLKTYNFIIVLWTRLSQTFGYTAR